MLEQYQCTNLAQLAVDDLGKRYTNDFTIWSSSQVRECRGMATAFPRGGAVIMPASKWDCTFFSTYLVLLCIYNIYRLAEACSVDSIGIRCPRF